MGGEKYRVPRVAVAAHLLLEDVGRPGIQAHHGLVQHPHGGIVNQRADDGQLLLHAPGVAADGIPRRMLQLEQRQVLLDMLLAALGVHAIDIRQEAQIFQPRQPLVQLVPVRHKADALLGRHRLLRHVLAVDHNPAGCGRENPGHQADGGGLACPVRADKSVNLTPAHMQAQVVHRLHAALAVLLGHMLKRDHNPSTSLCHSIAQGETPVHACSRKSAFSRFKASLTCPTDGSGSYTPPCPPRWRGSSAASTHAARPSPPRRSAPARHRGRRSG